MSAGTATHPTASASPAPLVRVLLHDVIDYAGLFPPASLGMAEAVAEYAAQRSGEHGWMLGRLVLPAARLEEFEAEAGPMLPREGAGSWALSALLSGDVEEDVDRAEAFNARHRDARSGAVQVDTVELKVQSARAVARAAELLDRRYDTYMEVPVADDPAPLIAAIAATSAKAKVRTGGVTPDLFPTGAQVVRFARSCIDHGVTFKATAGLHHAWRAEYPLSYAPDAPRHAMFGFLNVLLAVAALRAGWDEADAVRLLEERDGRAATFDPEGVLWRGRRIPADAVRRARETMAAFGSCSFREPVEDLSVARLL